MRGRDLLAALAMTNSRCVVTSDDLASRVSSRRADPEGGRKEITSIHYRCGPWRPYRRSAAIAATIEVGFEAGFWRKAVVRKSNANSRQTRALYWRMIMDRIFIETQDGDCPSYVFHPLEGAPWPAVLVFMDGLGIRPAMLAIGSPKCESSSHARVGAKGLRSPVAVTR